MNASILEVEVHNQRINNKQGTRMNPLDDLLPTPAARLGFLLQDRGVKQKDLAATLGISAPYLSTIVSGDKKNLPPDQWLRLAEHFGVTLDWLLCRTGAPMYWPANGKDEPIGLSKQADEAVRIFDSMPPRKRDEMLGVLRAMSFSTQLADLDAEKTTRLLRDSLAAAGIILSPKALDAVRATLFAFAMGLGPNEQEG